jgi:hypothetical protein
MEISGLFEGGAIDGWPVLFPGLCEYMGIAFVSTGAGGGPIFRDGPVESFIRFDAIANPGLA